MDIYQREGRYPVPPGASTILGVEFSGHVAELGSEVTQWKVTDEVFGIAGGVCVFVSKSKFIYFNVIFMLAGSLCGIYNGTTESRHAETRASILGASCEHSRELADRYINDNHVFLTIPTYLTSIYPY